MRRLLIVIFILLGYSFSYALADEIRGSVLLSSSKCPISDLVVEIDPQIGSSQSKIITTTNASGEFTAKVLSGNYLVVIYQQNSKVFQATIQVKGTASLPVMLSASGTISPLPCNQPNSAAPNAGIGVSPRGVVPIHFSLNSSDTHDWRPIDLALDTDGTFLVLDQYERVNRVFKTRTGYDAERLFAMPPSVKPIAVASNDQYVFATSKALGGLRTLLFQQEKQGGFSSFIW